MPFIRCHILACEFWYGCSGKECFYTFSIHLYSLVSVSILFR